jgi:hypothetical protein
MDFKKLFGGNSSSERETQPKIQSKGLPNVTLAKMRLASHPEATPESLRKLSDHNCDLVVIRVAEHPNTDQDILESLAQHNNPEVRVAVSENRNTPIQVLLTLVDDQSVDVRYCLAENHNIPLAILSALYDDENPYVAARAGQTLSRLRNSKNKSLGWLPVFRQELGKRDIG